MIKEQGKNDSESAHDRLSDYAPNFTANAVKWVPGQWSF